jgi:snurportin-1
MECDELPSGDDDGRASSNRALANALALPEWMSEVPEDLARSWLVVPRPAGQRCLVVSARGQTTARRRNGSVLARFSSALPGGRSTAAERGGDGSAKNAFCVLDCIYDHPMRTYHVLDVMVWRGYMLHDCHAQFRLYWTHTKLSEVGAQRTSRTNPCAFLPVPYHECTAESVARLHKAKWPFGRDGLLFVHRETVYEPGATPLLLLWADAACSARFFDYGSDEMRKRLAQAPRSAEGWRHEQGSSEQAITFEQLLRALAASEVAEAAEAPAAADAGLASVSAARA